MIKINADVETNINIELYTKGSRTEPKLRALLYIDDNYFIGIDGTSSTIHIPPLTDMIYNVEANLTIIIEVLIDQYRFILMEDKLDIVTDNKYMIENKIEITTKSVQIDEEADKEIRIKVI